MEYFLTESTDSISVPKTDGATVSTGLIPELIVIPLLSNNFPEKVKVLTPFPDSPLETTYETSTTFPGFNALPKTSSPNNNSYL